MSSAQIVYDITAPGLEDLIRVYDQAPALAQEALNRAMTRATLRLQSTGRKNAPVGATRLLRGSIDHEVLPNGTETEGRVYVGPDASYGVFVEGGADAWSNAPQWGSSKHGDAKWYEPVRQWCMRKLGDPDLVFPVMRKIMTQGITGQQFMHNTIIEDQERVNGYFAEEVRRIPL